MTDWYFLLAPAAVLAVLMLFRFVGCGAYIDSFDPYTEAVETDGPVVYYRLREKPGETLAKNEIGPPDGVFGAAAAPLGEGEAEWLSTGVANPSFDLGITDPHLIQTDLGSGNSALRVNGGFVQVPANDPPLNNLADFTVEVLLLPEWDVSFALGKYYCVIESADFVTLPNQPPPAQKNAGFGIYAGPDSTDPTSPYVWQFWVGVGQDGFQRLIPKPYVQVPGNPVPNPGPDVQPEPTYLAVTFSQTQSQAFLYLFTPNRDIDYTTYELNPLPYVPAAKELHIGIAPQGPLFPPFLGSPILLYPFKGLIGQVAIYDKVLDESTLRHHVINGFFNI